MPKRKITYILKTTADVLIAGLVCLEPLQQELSKIPSVLGYYIIIGILLIIIMLMYTYTTKKKGRALLTLGLGIALIISAVEIFLIGVFLEKEWEMIVLAWFIALPTVIIFDKLLG